MKLKTVLCGGNAGEICSLPWASQGSIQRRQSGGISIQNPSLLALYSVQEAIQFSLWNGSIVGSCLSLCGKDKQLLLNSYLKGSDFF